MIAERQEALDRLFSFRIKSLEYRGRLVDTYIEDDEMEAILRFKGTGIKTTFMDVVRAVWELNSDILEKQMSGEKTRPCFTHLEYITTNNLQVVYKSDDVVVRKSKCS